MSKRQRSYSYSYNNRPFKRLRGVNGYSTVFTSSRPVPRIAQRSRNIALYAPGYQRTSGFYGRYGNAARERGLLPEKKFFDTAVSFNFDATGEVIASGSGGQLCLIPQGDTEKTRDGRQCYIDSIQMRGVAVFAPGAATTATEQCYMYLVQDKQCNGAVAAIGDVFTSDVMSTNMLNLANSSRFRILKKWVMSFQPGAGAATAINSVSKTVDWYSKCNILLDFSSTTGAITELKSNNLFLCAGSAVADDTCSFYGTCRLRFRG